MKAGNMEGARTIKSSIGRNFYDEEVFDKILGNTRFLSDRRMKNSLTARALRSSHPHARIKDLDTSEAESVPGILAVLTAKDIPGENRFGVFIADRQVFSDQKVRSLADCLALVVGESPEAVEESLHKIRVSYEPLEAVFTPQEALKKDAPKVHESGNLLKHYKIRKGDVEAGFAMCDVIVESEYQTQTTDGCPLETESAQAWLGKDGVLEIWAATQTPQYDMNQITTALGLSESRVRVIIPPMGGGFGAKCEINCQILAGLATLKTGRPVFMHWEREESFRGHQKRSPTWYKVKTGATAQGKLLALKEEIFVDSGSYASWSVGVARNATIFSTGPYEIPNVHMDNYLVTTNNIHCGAQRGFGAPQPGFVAEVQIEKLAEKLAMDPAHIRRINAMDVGSSLSNQDVIRGSAGYKETLEKALEIIDWEKRKQEIREFNRSNTGSVRRGMGLASGFKNSGRLDDRAEAEIEVLPEKVHVYVNIPDFGQGIKIMAAQVTAEALTLPLEKIWISPNDSFLCPPAVGSFASRQTLCSGNAILSAAKQLKEKLLKAAARHWGVSEGEIGLSDGELRGPAGKHIPLLDFVRLHREQGLGVFKEKGVYQADQYIELDAETGKGACWYAYVFGTHVAVVDVDTETGEVVVKELVAVHDVGKAINPLAVEGQIEGGASMGLGQAVMENFIVEGDQIISQDLEKYPIPTSMDVPLIRSGYVEDREPLGPFGAKGFSECPVVPAAPAIINAIHAATGVWIDHLPATPERVYLALHQKNNSKNSEND